MPDQGPLVEARGLKKYYPVRGGGAGRHGAVVRAVDGVDLEVRHGETLGLVGESGCGKSTLGRLLLRLQEPTEGTLRFDGLDLLALKPAALRPVRRRMQIVFQDPFGSLDPRFTVEQVIGEVLEVHGLARGREKAERVAELMEMVGLDPRRRHQYPHEFSGGQRQRIGIARAVAPHPDFLVADEAVSALDVSVQSQILNLLMELQERLDLTYLFIAHGLNVVRHLSDRVGVMYLGQLVELAPAAELFARPAHPYTAALLSCVPRRDPGQRRPRPPLRGEVGSPAAPPSGCRFHPRCPLATPRCAQEVPVLRRLAQGRSVACHYPIT